MPEYWSFAFAMCFLSDAQVTSLEYLDHLVLHPRQMSGSCGVQIKVLFAPITWVLQYLEKTGQLTDVEVKAVGFLHAGSSDLLHHFLTPSSK